jgi:quercetin dioxygenase-like cupin family protein
MRRVLFLAGLVYLAAAMAMAQDPVKVDPQHHTVDFENDQVRVLRWKIAPHETSAMHEHPSNIVVFLTDADVKFTLPDGKTPERHAKAGQVISGGPVTHAAENIGNKPIELVQIELKVKPAAAEPAKK